MQLIGLIGGVASGKSRVAELFREQGAVVLDADRIGHEVLREPEVFEALVGRWGSEILSADGQIDRRAVAARVFGVTSAAQAELAFLESISHPRIGARLRAEIDHLRAAGHVPAAVLDAAVMLKAHWDRLCDHVVFVDAPREIRLARARQRGWTEEQFALREQSQETLAEKRSRATGVVDNSGPLDQTRQQVATLWRHWGLPGGGTGGGVMLR